MTTASLIAAVSYSPLPGWSSFESSDVLLADPSGVPTAWALSVPLSPADSDLVDKSGRLSEAAFPSETVAGLPSGGVVLVAALPVADPALALDSATYPAKSAPLLLEDADPGLTWDNVDELPSVYRLVVNASLSGSCVQVHIFVGLPDDDGIGLTSAEKQLAGLVIGAAKSGIGRV